MHTTFAGNRRRGFTIIEIMVVVAIIGLLVALLIPMLGRARANANKAATQAQIQGLQSALEAYNTDHHMYPPSYLVTNPYGPIIGGQGSLMLSEGLMGFLPQPQDGAGPMNAGDQPTPGGDPLYGFRTRNPQTMGGKIFGPYLDPERHGYVRLQTDGGTPGQKEFFIDSLGHDIIYYSSRGAPTAPVQQLLFGYDPAVHESFFFGNDNLSTVAFSNPPAGGKPAPGVNITTATNAFLKIIYPNVDPSPNNQNQYKGGTVLGADSYLLISCGADETYFTADDFVVAKP